MKNQEVEKQAMKDHEFIMILRRVLVQDSSSRYYIRVNSKGELRKFSFSSDADISLLNSFIATLGHTSYDIPRVHRSARVVHVNEGSKAGKELLGAS